MTISFVHRILAALVVTACAAPLPGTEARADEDDALRRVDFQVERSREVAPDRVTARLRVEHEDKIPARVADLVNRDMAWALDLAKERDEVEAKTGAYSTRALWDKRHIRGWHASQELIVESGDFTELSALIARLQERLQLSNMGFEVSPPLRREVTDELIDEALGAFRSRAGRIEKALGADGYEIVRVSVQESGAAPPVPMVRRAEALSIQSASVAPPVIEAGTTTLTVHVSATIELD